MASSRTYDLLSKIVSAAVRPRLDGFFISCLRLCGIVTPRRIITTAENTKPRRLGRALDAAIECRVVTYTWAGGGSVAAVDRGADDRLAVPRFVPCTSGLLGYNENSAFAALFVRAETTRPASGATDHSIDAQEVRRVVTEPHDGALFDRLVQIMATLRSPIGCPWDRAQDSTSLKPYLLEEAYEVLEAIEEGVPHKVKEELGDLLLQVIFHAQIARERGEFDIYDIVAGVIAKMIRRHPHVFGAAAASSPKEALQNWEEIKRQEKAADQNTSVLDGVPRQLPALLRAQRLQDKAARVGFEWEHVAQVWDKLEEELRELRAAAATQDRAKVEEEVGDVLFSLVNLARFLDVNPDEALHKTTTKFIQRFQYIERELSRQGKTPKQATLAEMDALWEEAKQQECA